MILTVKSYEPRPLNFHNCIDENGQRHRVDFFASGCLSLDTKAGDLVGKKIEISRLTPFEEIAYDVRILEEISEKYYFTFGGNHEQPNGYAVFYGTEESTRAQMVEAFGSKWAFQYSETRWNYGGISQAEKYGLHQIN